ncbi:FHA domain protein [Cognatiyoonia koreensis]|uniref:FHA domain protein n=1 Tax=Cognatiyoonia koreensis TaxID=364200 RepID=A0A1I0RGB8_9RHOB|nr:type VI secretion system-associated FHA domain protein TagH [Cognatiyoonia koreensis]SEW39958.1 FHA domain protein [Cognatiyoonia koreensis]
MTLTLRIENFDSLPDGGPLSVTSDGNDLQVGRSASMDWSLPDPQRHISGHHFDVSFRNGKYFLTDVSTNGVFLEGQRHRIEGAHELKSGERFQVGHYFITVSLGDAAVAAAAPPPQQVEPPQPTPPVVDDNSDPWAIGGSPAAPIDPNPRSDRSGFDDFASDFISTPTAPQPQAAPATAAPQPAAAPSPFGGSGSPFDGAPAPGAGPVLSRTPPTAPTALPIATPPQTPAQPAGGDAVLKAFCEGAGLRMPAGATTDPEAFARELGRTLRGASTEVMAMLQDRAAAKKFTKGGDRTMMGAAQNNPLKFLPDVDQALEVMFLHPRDGFMSGGDGLTDALADVRQHQVAVFAAIQPALIKLMSKLAPEDIEEALDGGLLSGGKRKAWDEFVRRWDKMTTSHENGMLDVFLSHFAESYSKATKGSGL